MIVFVFERECYLGSMNMGDFLFRFGNLPKTLLYLSIDFHGSSTKKIIKQCWKIFHKYITSKLEESYPLQVSLDQQ